MLLLLLLLLWLAVRVAVILVSLERRSGRAEGEKMAASLESLAVRQQSEQERQQVPRDGRQVCLCERVFFLESNTRTTMMGRRGRSGGASGYDYDVSPFSSSVCLFVVVMVRVS